MKAPATIEMRPAPQRQGEKKTTRADSHQPNRPVRVGKMQRMDSQHAFIQVCRDLPTECWFG